MLDEIELLRQFRDDVAEPPAGAWSRARSAIEAVASADDGQQARRRNRRPSLASGRTWWLVPVVAGAAAAAIVSVLLPGPAPLTQPLRTAWQPARQLPHSSSAVAGGTGWRLASYIVSAGWRRDTEGPEPGYLTCPTTSRCYVQGNNSDSPSGPADMDSLYVSSDGAATWSVLPVPSGVAFTSAMSCGTADDCAAGATRLGQPVLARTADGGHSWTLDPLPATVGRIFQIDCVTATTCAGLGTPEQQPLSPGFTMMMADARFVVTADGGRTFKVSEFPRGQSAQALSCSAALSCVVVGVYDQGFDNFTRGWARTSGDGGASWHDGRLPHDVSPGPSSAITCSDASDCWSLGYLNGNTVLLKSADGGLTWVTNRLPASIPEPQLTSLACPSAAVCYAAGEEAVPQRIGNTFNGGSAVVVTTTDGGRHWGKVTFAVPSKVPGKMQGDAFMSVASIQCPAVGSCVGLGASEQGAKQTPVYRGGK